MCSSLLRPLHRKPYIGGRLRCVLGPNRSATIEAEHALVVQALMPRAEEFGIARMGNGHAAAREAA